MVRWHKLIAKRRMLYSLHLSYLGFCGTVFEKFIFTEPPLSPRRRDSSPNWNLIWGKEAIAKREILVVMESLSFSERAVFFGIVKQFNTSFWLLGESLPISLNPSDTPTPAVMDALNQVFKCVDYTLYLASGRLEKDEIIVSVN